MYTPNNCTVLHNTFFIGNCEHWWVQKGKDDLADISVILYAVGYIESIVSLFFTELFLHSRPVNQKNILNSQLHLIVYFQILYTSRIWIVAIAGSMFLSKTFMVFKLYPGVVSALLYTKQYVLSLFTAFFTMSISKLIPVLSPARFQNLSARGEFCYISAPRSHFHGTESN